MNKKFLKSFFLVLLAMLMCVNLFACKKDGDGTNGDGSQPTEDPGIPLTVDFSKYIIIRPVTGGAQVSNASASLYKKMQNAGINIKLSDDWLKAGETPDENAYEILLGATNRSQSEEALNSIPEDKTFVIKFYEKKIVINAKNNIALLVAIDYFCNTYVAAADENKVLNTKLGESYYGVADSMLELIKEGQAIYHLVRPQNASQVEKDAVVALQQKMISLTKTSVRIYDDFEYDANTTEIVIGPTSFPETQQVLDTLNYGQYAITKVNNKIIITGHTTVTTKLAVEEFMEMIVNYAFQEPSGKYSLMIPSIQTTVENYGNWLGDIPQFTGGTYDGLYECGNENIMLRYKNADATKIDAYVQELANSGFAKKQENTIGSNRYVTCLGEKGMVYVAYQNNDKTISIITDPLVESKYKPDEGAWTKVTDTTLAINALDYSNYTCAPGCSPMHDNNGECYVVTLEDGRYIIMDGGYSEPQAEDATLLYEYLRDNNKRPDGKIVIAAWIFSHSDGDHVGCFQSFSRYAKNVTVEYFIANGSAPSNYANGTGNYLSGDSFRAARSLYSGSKLLKPHTGQKLSFCNVEFEIIYTQENLLPATLSNENECTMVYRMYVNGMSLLFMGDAMNTACGKMVSMHGSALKSDFLQIPHHGTTGLTSNAYDAVDPDYTLWTTSNTTFAARIAGSAYPVGLPSQATADLNKRIYTELGADHCFNADYVLASAFDGEHAGSIRIINLTKSTLAQLSFEYFTYAS